MVLRHVGEGVRPRNGQMQQLLAEIATAETGQRAYLVTGDPAALAEYRAVADEPIPTLVALRRLLSGR